MFRSIRRSLLLWHGLVLLSVIAGFGAILYFELERSMLQEIDAEITEDARGLGDALEAKPGRRFELRLTEEYRRRVRMLDASNSYYVVSDPGGRIVDRSAAAPAVIPTDPVPPPAPGELSEARPRPGLARKGGLPPGLAKRGGLPPGLAKRGGLPPGLARKAAAPRGERADGGAPGAATPGAYGEPPRDDGASPGKGIPAGTGVRPVLHNRGTWREVRIRGPRGEMILVGRHTGGMRRRLDGFLEMGLAAGLGVLALALAGDWFLSGRALRPIARMAATAAKISASNLTQRLDVERTESELGVLARVLNGTFDRLEAAFARQARFTSDASHELRTPLAVVIANAEVALRKDRSAPEYRETVETCLKAARRMKALVEGLLTLARADACGADLRKERLDLARRVGEAATFLEPLAAARHVRLEVVAEPVEVDGDPDRLHELVTNLVSNAIRYNREGGRIDVTVRGEGDCAVLTVADTGIGIPEDDRPLIFERFYRVDEARSRELGGAGLGLALAKSDVEAHGGSISCESEEGVGTTFTVRLPIHAGSTPDPS